MRDILLWIRIRGSVQLTYGSDPAFFVSGWQDASKNKLFFLSSFADYILKVHLYLSSKMRCANQEKLTEIKVLLTFFIFDGRIRIQIRTNNDGSGSERPKNTHIRIHNTGKNDLLSFLAPVSGSMWAIWSLSETPHISNKDDSEEKWSTNSEAEQWQRGGELPAPASFATTLPTWWPPSAHRRSTR